MKEFFKNNKFKIIIFLIFTYIILMFVDLYFYRKFVNSSFNKYIEAQDLENEYSDNGFNITNDNFFLIGKLKREVVYTENFRTHYIYEISGRRIPFIPVVNLIDYKINIEKNPKLYKGVNFYNLDYEGKKIFGEFGDEKNKIYEGQLDKDGKLLTELPWVKNYNYDEDGPEVKRFLKLQNELMKELYEDGSEKELIQFKNLRELYKYGIEDGTFDGAWSYEEYLRYVVDSMMYEIEAEEEYRQQQLDETGSQED